MVGRRNTVVDLWELPSPNAVQATLSDPELAKYGQQISEIAEDETLTMMTKLPIGGDWLLKFFPSLGMGKNALSLPPVAVGTRRLRHTSAQGPVQPAGRTVLYPSRSQVIGVNQTSY
jgi:hypothetical protein